MGRQLRTGTLQYPCGFLRPHCLDVIGCHPKAVVIKLAMDPVKIFDVGSVKLGS